VGGEEGGRVGGKGEGWKQRAEMTQALYAHMNKKIKTNNNNNKKGIAIPLHTHAPINIGGQFNLSHSGLFALNISKFNQKQKRKLQAERNTSHIDSVICC
jgi:hypothetical protein